MVGEGQPRAQQLIGADFTLHGHGEAEICHGKKRFPPTFKSRFKGGCCLSLVISEDIVAIWRGWDLAPRWNRFACHTLPGRQNGPQSFCAAFMHKLCAYGADFYLHLSGQGCLATFSSYFLLLHCKNNFQGSFLGARTMANMHRTAIIHLQGLWRLRWW